MATSVSSSGHVETEPRILFILAAVFWTVVILVMALWHYRQSYSAALEMARTEARSSYHPDLIISRWASLQSGVYVPVTKESPPSPYLANNPERDITTPSGKKLTMIGPTYMLRALHGLAETEHGAQGHITSLNPLDPANAPDECEKTALVEFERGEKEVSSLEMFRGEMHLRLMRPIITETVCLGCHASQGYKLGDIRGGACVSVPWKPYQEAVLVQLPGDVLGFGGIWAIGIVGLVVARYQIRRQVSRRRQAMDALSESEKQNRAIVNAVPDLLFRVSKDGVILDYRSRDDSSLYVSPEMFLGKNIKDVLPPNVSQPAMQAIEKALHSNELEIFEYDLPINGDRRHFEDRVVPFSNDEVLSVIRDITKRKRAEDALKLALEWKESIFEGSRDAVFISDVNSRFVTVNRAASELTGYSKEELLAMQISDLHEHMDLHAYQTYHNRIIAGEEILDEARILREDGTKVDTEFSNRCIIIAGTTYMHTTARDITERKRAETVLAMSLSEQKNIMETIPNIVFVLDLNGNLVKWNGSLEKVTGYSPEELLGKPAVGFFDEEYQPIIAQAIRKAFEDGYNEVESPLPRKDGTTIPYLWNGAVLRDGKGSAIGVTGVGRNLTEHKRMVEAILRSETSLRTILQSTADGILAVGSENEVLYANERFVDLWRIPQKVMVSKNDSVLLQHVLDQLSDPQGFLKKVQELYKSNEGSFDTVYFKDGRVFERLSCPLLQGTKLHGRVWSFRDITERKRAQQALEEESARRRILFEESADGILIIDPQTARFLEFNAAAHRQLGYSREEFAQLSIIDVESQETADETRAHIEDVIRDGRADFETLQRTRQGEIRNVYITAQVINVQGHPVYYCIWRDITERKRAEIQIQYQANLLRNVSDAILATDRKFNIQYWNSAAEKQYGWAAEEVIGSHFTKFIQPLYSSESRKAVMQRIVQEGRWSGELLHNRRDGTLFPVLATISEIKDAEGQVVGHIAINRDITERKRAEDELEESREKYHCLSDASFEAIFISEKGICLEQNKTAEKMFGYSISEAVGRNGAEWIAPEDRDTVMNNMLSGYEKPYEVTALRKDGSTFPANIQGRMMHFKGRDVRVTSLTDITERKQAEEAKQMSEERQSLILESLPVAIYTAPIDPGVGATWITEKVAEMTGYSAEQFVEDPRLWRDHLHPEDRTRVEEAFQHAIASGQVSVEYRFEVKDGSYKWFLDTAIIHKSSNSVPDFFGVIADITEGKRAEEEIMLLAQAIASIKDCVSITDLENRFTFVNNAFELVYGYTSKELLGKHASILRSPKMSQETANEILPATLAGGWYGEVMNRRKNGADFPVELWTSLVKDEAGKLFALVGVARDITDRKWAEELLHKLRKAVDTSGEAIFLTDKKGIFTYVNPGFTTLYGYTGTEVIGKVTPRILKSGRLDPQSYTRFWNILMSGKEARGDFSNKRKDGKIIEVEGSASPILDDERNTIGFLGIQRDITERKLDHQSVKASRDQLRQLATRLEHVREEERAGIAREIHDELGQDLTAVKMNVSWLARKLKGNESLQKKLQHVQDLVDIAIQAVRRIATQLRPAVLDELGLGAAIEWQAQKFTMDSHIKCVVNLDPAAVPVSQEISTALFRILQEALTNVERHANATKVKVKLATFGKYLYLEVADDGRGIHTKQLNDPRSIGLLGMKERALALGGEVTFTSLAGSGTTVTATIPLGDS